MITSRIIMLKDLLVGVSSWKKLEEQIGPWLEKILESESEKSMSVSSDRLKSTIKLLNQIGKDLLEAKDLESGEDDEGTGQKKKEKN